MITLDDKPYRAKFLAEYAKLSVGQVYSALKKLRKYGLVEKITGGFRVIPQKNVDDALKKQVAIPAKTLGKTEKRKHKHQWQRAKYAERELDKARYFDDKRKEELQTKHYKCGNCGQMWWMGDFEPPPICDFCKDMTTWQLM
jgi:sugar-specific transcriptional regulator TrmB